MAIELVAIWVIVVGVVIWFIRDERRLAADAALQRAARYYAHAPKYRHVSSNPESPAVPAPRPRTGGLSADQRAFIRAYVKP